MKPINVDCEQCGALPGKPCRQVGPGGGQAGPPAASKLGIEMVTFHAKRRRAAAADAEILRVRSKTAEEMTFAEYEAHMERVREGIE